MTKMFSSKKKTLGTKVTKKTSGTAFTRAGMRTAAVKSTANGGKAYKTTGNPFVDQFGSLSNYKTPRDFAIIAADCERLWAVDPHMTVVFGFYLRTISRPTQFFNGRSTKLPQRGGELKHEGIMRMIWLHTKEPNAFWANIEWFITLGSWKDVITMLQYDLVYHGWEGRILDWEKFGKLILAGLKNGSVVDLIKKYLPSIKSRSKCKTVEAEADNMIGKWICSLLFGSKEDGNSYKKYRKLKTSGKAHEWQKLISQGRHAEIDFATIHGRALSLLVRSKYLFNQELSAKYEAWVTKPEVKTVKYTGFVHELFMDYKIDKIFRFSLNNVTPKVPLTSVPKHIQATINKQFEELVNKGKGGEAHPEFIVVRDTSGSMRTQANGTKMSCYDVGKALALYFSSFLKGRFANHFIEFHSTATMREWSGKTPLEKWFNDTSGYYGSTNFDSVINLFVRLKAEGVPESDFPKGILCISDSEFNPSRANTRTAIENVKPMLRAGGFSEEFVNEFKVILWNLAYAPTHAVNFQTDSQRTGVFYYSGYSASTIAFLTSKIKNAEELFFEAMNQEILNMIKL